MVVFNILLLIAIFTFFIWAFSKFVQWIVPPHFEPGDKVTVICKDGRSRNGTVISQVNRVVKVNFTSEIVEDVDVNQCSLTIINGR